MAIAPTVRKSHPTPGSQTADSQDRDAPTLPGLASFGDSIEYLVDLSQRSLMFFDLMRRRGDAMLEHEVAGLPPLLGFEFETVLDAREFESPASFALLRIIGPKEPVKSIRPVMVFDPRAGHGPGIGGFKKESEVGVALDLGHPVYFVSFFPEPMPGQTLADVHHALRRFVREVARRHPGLAPVLYGNCQAGWAVALMSADCTGVPGLAVLNGSPLSYWSGSTQSSPMRAAGTLAGGTWWVRMLSDLAEGRFDGAWLVQNFEQLHPAQALLEKYLHVFENPEGEGERFLAFERWWGGFYFFNREEIVAIVEHLFVGNQLEQGTFQVCPCCVVDMRRIRNPLVIFASSGDDITPPEQAIGWLRAVWPSTEALVAAGQRIAYLVHPTAGHLGLFVSSEVARHEHRALLGNVETLTAMEPGLYQLFVDETGRGGVPTVRFERRRIEELPEAADTNLLESARDRSRMVDALYQQLWSPTLQVWSNPWSAFLMKWFHPMRLERIRYASIANPVALPIHAGALASARYRRPARQDNPWLRHERTATATASAALEALTDARDAWCEQMFSMLFANSGETLPLKCANVEAATDSCSMSPMACACCEPPARAGQPAG